MARIEFRSENGREFIRIDGYVNVTERNSRPIPKKEGGYFIERIMRGAFKKALDKTDEVKILLNHKTNRVLGSTKTNLFLKEDVIGLRAIADISDAEVIKKAKEKRLRGWSFGFAEPVEQRSEVNGMETRSISDMDLLEVSLIDEEMRPWYESTTVETRAEESGEITLELRAEEFEMDYVGFEEKPDNSKLKNLIEKLGGNVK